MAEETSWERQTIQVAAGDLLVLYTDGLPDAENQAGSFFGERRLLETIQTHVEQSAHAVRDCLLTEIHNFVGDAPQFDDITLIIVKRDVET